MYFNYPKDFTGFRDKPSGVVLLEECNVREVSEDSNLGECLLSAPVLRVLIARADACHTGGSLRAHHLAERTLPSHPCHARPAQAGHSASC
jgi:hypothetical protein